MTKLKFTPIAVKKEALDESEKIKAVRGIELFISPGSTSIANVLYYSSLIEGTENIGSVCVPYAIKMGIENILESHNHSPWHWKLTDGAKHIYAIAGSIGTKDIKEYQDVLVDMAKIYAATFEAIRSEYTFCNAQQLYKLIGVNTEVDSDKFILTPDTPLQEYLRTKGKNVSDLINSPDEGPSAVREFVAEFVGKYGSHPVRRLKLDETVENVRKELSDYVRRELPGYTSRES